jgi:histone-lysine N-methyltransferase SUV420H
VYYWSSIRKLKANYHPCRGVQEDLVCKILQQHVIIEKDPVQAHTALLELPGIAKYCRSLKTEDEKEHFERHLRKYVNIYLPDCPFEVDTTNRYTIMTAEACIKARKPIKKGEAIKYLSGIQVEMTEKEEKELSSRTDFSIVLSSRRKRPSLFLGPARFANHDCDSNAKLNTTGPHGIHIVARKDIEAGDEITVTYGDDYFGIDNCECLCATCESLTRNGWDPRGPLLNEDSSDGEDEEDESEPTKARRNLKSESHSRSPSTLGKRKRITDEIAPRENEKAERRGKRSRGRPKQHRYGGDEDEEEVKVSATTPKYRRRDALSEESTRVGDRDSLEELAESRRNSRGHILPQAEDMSTPGRSESSLERQAWSPSPSPNGLLEKIFNLLESIGERKLQEEELKSRTATPKPATPLQAAGGAQSEALPEDSSHSKPETSQNTDQQSNRSDSLLLLARSSLSCPRGLSRTPSTERVPPPNRSISPDKSNLQIHKAKLHATKKERSTSSLRNVINAKDEDPAVFSISPSPASPDRLGSSNGPCKDQAENEEPDSTGSSSPSSHNDYFSATSQTSSMTSLESESFAAGNIAFSICQMLTTEVDEDLGEEQHKPSTATDEANAEDAMEIDESDTIESAPSRGRKQLRTSPRKAQPATSTATSTPPVQSIENNEQDEDDEDDEKRGEARTPGDYTLCKALLSTTYHRWVECRNCDEFFVQGDAYLTRIACPRCERHSKLYGYYWPKTDKDGKFDKEARVLDHRTIHRFIDPEDERSEPKGRKTLVDVIRERELSSRQESEEVEQRIEKRLRNSPRRSESRRKMRTTM